MMRVGAMPKCGCGRTKDPNGGCDGSHGKLPELDAEYRCFCYNCNKDRKTEQGWPWVATRMILCPKCGNKRCPHSTDHNLECTDSNEPGQPGSRYE